MRSGARRLTQEIRDLIEVVRTSDPPDSEAEDIARILNGITARIEPFVVEGTRLQSALTAEDGPGDGVQGRADFGLQLIGRHPDELFPYSPVLGELNPIAPPCRLRFVAGEPYGRVEGEAILGTAFVGPPDAVHGGVVAALLDEVLGGACGVNGLAGFTGSLTVRYLAKVPIGRRITMTGRVTGTERRKVFAAGELLDDGVVCAEADGVFVRPESPDP